MLYRSPWSFGHLQEAQQVIDELPFRADGVIWATFLATCRMHKDEKRSKIVAKRLIELEPQSSSTYVCPFKLARSSW
jgi:hypothetical protein